MFLECTCADIRQERWDELMNGAKRADYRKLVALIKKEMPELYYGLDLKINNPYKKHTYKTDTHFILTHSATEYFINKN